MEAISVHCQETEETIQNGKSSQTEILQIIQAIYVSI
jgi:hypothetical protein